MADLISTFQDGKLLMYDSVTVDTWYIGSGVPVKIGELRKIDKVLSLDTDYSRYGLITRLEECRTSGNYLFVVMRRGDLGAMPITSSSVVSGQLAYDLLSGITSGIAYLGELLSGVAMISGRVIVKASVIGW